MLQKVQGKRSRWQSWEAVRQWMCLKGPLQSVRFPDGLNLRCKRKNKLDTGGGEKISALKSQTWIQIPLDHLLVVRSWAKYWALFSSLGDIASSLFYYYEDWKNNCQLKSVRFKLWYVLEFFSKFSNIYNFQNAFRKKKLGWVFISCKRGKNTIFYRKWLW